MQLTKCNASSSNSKKKEKNTPRDLNTINYYSNLAQEWDKEAVDDEAGGVAAVYHALANVSAEVRNGRYSLIISVSRLDNFHQLHHLNGVKEM